jgi:hypothetical protein
MERESNVVQDNIPPNEPTERARRAFIPEDYDMDQHYDPYHRVQSKQSPESKLIFTQWSQSQYMWVNRYLENNSEIQKFQKNPGKWHLREFIYYCALRGVNNQLEEHRSTKGKHRKTAKQIVDWLVHHHFPHNDRCWCQRTKKFDLNICNVKTVSASGSEITAYWSFDTVIRDCYFCHGNGGYYDKMALPPVWYEERGAWVSTRYALQHLRMDATTGMWHDRTSMTPHDIAVDALAAGRVPAYHVNKASWRNAQFHSGDDPHYGIELEIRSRSHRKDVCLAAVDVGMFGERDGSLHNTQGIEIVGYPQTFQDSVKKDGVWMKFLNSIKGKAEGWTADGEDMDGHHYYGMHVNISRKSMTPTHQIKLVCFIHNNRDFCVSIAGRNENHYSQFRTKPEDEGALYSEDKYDAAAIRSNERIEVRIFKSTVNPSCFLKNVEFCDAVLHYTKPKDVTFKDLNQTGFIAWMKKDAQSERYPHLYNHLFKKPIVGD